MVLSNIKYLIYFIISHKFCEGWVPSLPLVGNRFNPYAYRQNYVID